MNKIFDIYYKSDYMVFCVSAKNKKQAKEIARKQLFEMTKNELVDRFLASLESGGEMKIIGIEDTGERE